MSLIYVKRFHANKLAEMPFAGTMPLYQRHRMMGRLIKDIEQGVQRLREQQFFPMWV